MTWQTALRCKLLPKNTAPTVLIRKQLRLSPLQPRPRYPLHQADGGWFPHLDRGGNSSVREPSRNWLGGSVGHGAYAVHGATSVRCDPHGSPAHSKWALRVY